MRIVECRPGQSLELRGDSDRGSHRERWGSVPLAFAFPLLLPHAAQLIDPAYVFPARFTEVWIWIFLGSLLLELHGLVTDRTLVGIRFDRSRNECTIRTRSGFGKVRTWTSDLSEITVHSIVTESSDDHRTELVLELRAVGAAKIPAVGDIGALDIATLIASVLLLPFRLLNFPLSFFDRQRAQTLDLAYDGGDPQAVRALAAEIGAITGSTPSIDPESSNSAEGTASMTVTTAALHSAFATLAGDLRERGLVPIPAEAGDAAAGKTPAGVRVEGARVLFPGDLGLHAASRVSLFFSLIFLATAVLRGGLFEVGPVGATAAIFLAVGTVLLVRAAGSFLHLHGGRVRLDGDEQMIRGGILGGTRTDFGEVEKIVDVSIGGDDPQLVVVTAGGSFPLPIADETPPPERAWLAAELARRIGVSAFSLTLPRSPSVADSGMVGSGMVGSPDDRGPQRGQAE